METERFEKDDIERIAAVIRQGGLVAIATDTVYGLASASAGWENYRKLVKAKDRPETKPFPLMVAHAGQIETIAVLTQRERYLIKRFMPGAVTFVFNLKDEAFPYLQERTIGIRMADDPWVAQLIELVGCPLWLPSANRSGYPTATDSKMVLEQLSGKIEGVVNGSCEGGVASSVFDVTGAEVRCLRHGPVSLEEVKKEEAYFENSIIK